MKPHSFIARKSGNYLIPELAVLRGNFGSVMRLKIFAKIEGVNTTLAKVVVFDENTLQALIAKGMNESGECEINALSADRKLTIICECKDTNYKTMVYNGVRAV